MDTEPQRHRDHQAGVLLLAIVTTAVVLAFDLSIPLGVAAGVPYVLVVLISLWLPRRSHTLSQHLEIRTRTEELEAQQQALAAANRALEETTAQAEAASRSKSEFLANMSHEIRTPMTAILGFCETLLEPDLSEPERINAVQTIQRNGDHLLGVINDILDLSKIEAGRMAVERIRCSPCEIVAGVLSLVRMRTEAKGLVFAVEYEGPIPEAVRCDATRLRQILINLIGNAVKFTETGGVRLVVRYAEAGLSSALSFDVVDTGIGMTADVAASLFDPFTQADTSTTRQFGGTGLGLSISKRLATMLGGDVELVETESGVGSRFRVTVAAERVPGTGRIDDPRQATVATPEATPSETPADKTPLAQLRILLAEDGLDNQRLIAHVLRKAGAEVTVADNGKKALDQALSAKSDEQPFDVILMDMQMPVMDGYEATRQLRDHDYTAPILALTAHAMATDRDKCLAAGCDEFATKPVNRKALIALIRRFIGTASTPAPTPVAV